MSVKSSKGLKWSTPGFGFIAKLLTIQMTKNNQKEEDFDFPCSRTWREGGRIKDSSSKLSTAQRIERLEAMIIMLTSEIQTLKENAS